MKSDKAELEEKAWRACKGAINSIWQSPHSWCFREPVDEEKHRAPSYYTVIKDPQDLLTIRTRLENAKYKSPLEVDVAVRKMCDNAFTYNAEDHDVHKAARSVLAQWIDLWESRNVAALWGAAQDPVNRAVLLNAVSGRRAAAATVAASSGLPNHNQQQQQQPLQQQPLQQQAQLQQQSRPPKQQQQQQQAQRPRQQSIPSGGGGGGGGATLESRSQPVSREPSAQPSDHNVQAQQPGGEGDLQQARGEQHQQQQQQQQLEQQQLLPQPGVQQQLHVQTLQPQNHQQQQQQQQQQQHLYRQRLGHGQEQQQQQRGEKLSSKSRRSRTPILCHLPLTPSRILSFTPSSLGGSDHSPVPLLLSLLRAATWLPHLFISCGRLRAQVLGGRTSDPELLLVRCLCSECGSQLLPGYMPLTHFYMHARGAEGDAVGLDEVNTPSASETETEGRSTEAGAGAGSGGITGPGTGLGGSSTSLSRARARVRVADMESLKQRLWSSLRCGSKLEEAVEAPFLDMIRQRSETAGGASLVGRRVFVYHFSEFLLPPNNLYGTWQPATIKGYNAESGEHELRYERDPNGPVELVQLAVNFLHFGEKHPLPGFRPLGPNGEIYNTDLHVSSFHTYFTNPAGQDTGTLLAPRDHTGVARVISCPPTGPPSLAPGATPQQQQSSGPAPLQLQVLHRRGPPGTYPRSAVQAVAAAAAVAFSTAGLQDDNRGPGPGPGSDSGQGQGQNEAGGSGGGAAAALPNGPPGSAANAIVIEDDDDDEATRPHAAAQQQQPMEIVSPFSLRQAAAFATGQQPHPHPHPHPHAHAHAQQHQTQAQTPYPQQQQQHSQQQLQQQRQIFLNQHAGPHAVTTAVYSASMHLNQQQQNRPPTMQYSTLGPGATINTTTTTTTTTAVDGSAAVGVLSAAASPTGGGAAAAAVATAGGSGTCTNADNTAAGVGQLASGQPATGAGGEAGVAVAVKAGAGGASPGVPKPFIRSLQPTIGDPKMDMELDRKCCNFAMMKLLTPDQRQTWETGPHAAKQQLAYEVLRTVESNPALEQRVLATASEVKRKYLQRYQDAQQQQLQLQQGQGQGQTGRQQPQQHRVSMNGVDNRFLQQQHQHMQQQQQQNMLIRQYQMQQHQQLQRQQHQQTFLHAGSAGYGAPSAGALHTGVPAAASAPYGLRPSIQVPPYNNFVAQRPQQPCAPTTVATPTPNSPPQQSQSHHNHQHVYPIPQPSTAAAAAPATMHPTQPTAAGAMGPYVHHKVSRALPGAAAGHTSESSEHQVKRQRLDASAAAYGPHNQPSASAPALGLGPGGAASAVMAVSAPPPPHHHHHQQQQQQQHQHQVLPQPQPLQSQLQPQLVEQRSAQQHSVSPPSQPMPATAASSGGRGSVSGGAGDECVAGGTGGAGGGGGGGCGGGRFRPMPPHLTDVIEITRALVELMEQLPLSAEEGRAVRKALRQLQAAGKDKFIQMAYVTMCSAAKAADEEEIRDTFEDFRREAARCQ